MKPPCRFFAFTYRKVGGGAIATGTLQIHATCGLGLFSIPNAMFRITMKHNSVLVCEDFFMTKEDGRTPETSLYVDEIQTIGYKTDIRARHFHAIYVALPLYPGIHNEFIIYMMSKLRIQTQPMLQPLHKLHERSKPPFSFKIFLYAPRYLNPTLPAELLRQRAEGIQMQLSRETNPVFLPP